MRPKASTPALINALHCSVEVTSVLNATASPPALRIDSATSSRKAWLRAPSTTLAPSAAANLASVCPRPGPTPLITITLPFSNIVSLPNRSALTCLALAGLAVRHLLHDFETFPHSTPFLRDLAWLLDTSLDLTKDSVSLHRLRSHGCCIPAWSVCVLGSGPPPC